MKIKELTIEYFNFFRLKDIENLKKLFDSKICLRDWEIEVSGFNNVVEKNIEIFNALGDFDLSVDHLYLIDNVIFAEIVIATNGEKIKVLDKIEFNSNCKIQKITAYKG